MRKNVFGRKLGRDKNERQALFKSLMSALVLNETIQTSEAKAKAIKPEMEKLVTKAKKGEVAARKVVEKSLSKDAFEKMIKEIGPRFAKRNGGYTRLIKLGKRFGDDSPMVVMEWVEKAQIVAVVPQAKSEKKAKVAKPVKKAPVKKAVSKAKPKTVRKPAKKK